MVRFIFGVLALFGFLVLAGVAGGSYFVYKAMFAVAPLPEAIVLSFDLDRKLVEEIPDDPLRNRLFGRDLSLRAVVGALDRGAHDQRVRGAVLRLGGDGIGLAQVQEIRSALARFHAAGKFTTAFAESFGEFGPGNKSYYLATACDQIWLQPCLLYTSPSPRD